LKRVLGTSSFTVDARLIATLHVTYLHDGKPTQVNWEWSYGVVVRTAVLLQLCRVLLKSMLSRSKCLLRGCRRLNDLLSHVIMQNILIHRTPRESRATSCISLSELGSPQAAHISLGESQIERSNLVSKNFLEHTVNALTSGECTAFLDQLVLAPATSWSPSAPHSLPLTFSHQLLSATFLNSFSTLSQIFYSIPAGVIRQ